ncbi:16462_t:CDS:2, partial [Acaulospora colombiana]
YREREMSVIAEMNTSWTGFTAVISLQGKVARPLLNTPETDDGLGCVLVNKKEDVDSMGMWNKQITEPLAVLSDADVTRYDWTIDAYHTWRLCFTGHQSSTWVDEFGAEAISGPVGGSKFTSARQQSSQGTNQHSPIPHAPSFPVSDYTLLNICPIDLEGSDRGVTSVLPARAIGELL